MAPPIRVIAGSSRQAVAEMTCRWVGFLIAIAICLGAGTGCTRHTGSENSSAASIPPRPSHVTELLKGLPAIPRTRAGSPSFSLADAQAYARSHRLSGDVGTNQKSVISSSFATSAAVSKLLDGETVGVPDKALVCVVVVQGSFVFLGPPGGTSVKYSKAYEVFDGNTGNLLLVGGSVKSPRELTLSGTPGRQ
jgi:hypothetical protein